jgi:hypothetical protein
MAIQYAGGTNRNSVVAADTRLLIVDNLKAELVAAGWSVASGASGDWKLNSATTPNGHKYRVRLYDPASNAAAIYIMNQAETLAPAASAWLVPGAGLTYRILANKYQFFVFTPGSVVARQFAASGVLMVPSFLTVDACAAFSVTNAMNAADPSAKGCWRSGLFSSGSGTACIYDGNQWTSVSGSAAGMARLVRQGDPNNSTDSTYRWHDGSLLVYDAVVAWGLTASSDEPKLRGLLWDAFICSGDFTADTVISFDGKNFMAITSANTGTSRGTLFVYAP